MSFVVGAAFTAAGFTMAYWGVNNIRQWVQGTGSDTSGAVSSLSTGITSVPMPVLLGLRKLNDPKHVDPDGLGKGVHKVPFPYKAPEKLQATPSGNTGGTGGGNGAQLSPNYPGGPNGTIPTPGIPGGQSV